MASKVVVYVRGQDIQCGRQADQLFPILKLHKVDPEKIVVAKSINAKGFFKAVESVIEKNDIEAVYVSELERLGRGKVLDDILNWSETNGILIYDSYHIIDVELARKVLAKAGRL